jgi:hypothetical protein
MIRIMLGKMGSGKTACMVREMINNEDDKVTFANIIIHKKVNNVVQIKRDMIINRNLIGTQKNGKQVYEYKFNDTFWKDTRNKYNGINVVLDEAHTLIDSRRAMSKENVIMNDFMALLRRILGDSGDGYGELVLITQLGRRLDIIARELATSVHYHVAHYIRKCKKCQFAFKENNEMKDKPKLCPRCNFNKFSKHNFVIEKWEFENMDYFDMWLECGKKSYYKHYYVTDIENYFNYYDTFQWENLISEY